MDSRRKNALIVLGTLSGVILLVSNLLATKIFSFFGIPMDAGILIYPLIYVVNDLILMIVSKNDERTPKIIIFTSFFANVVVAALFFVAILLPAYSGWENQAAFETIFGFAPRVIFGSFLGFLASSLINMKIFKKIEKSEVVENSLTMKKLFKKAFGSSAVAKFFDVFIFEVVAFLGVLSISDFFLQAGFAYLVGIFLEIPLSVLTCFVYRKLFVKEQ